MRRLALAACVALAACAAPDPAVHRLALHLVDDDPGCLPIQIAKVRSVLVLATGEDAHGAACRLASHCVDTDVASSLAALEGQLVAAPQPTLDVEADRVVHLRLLGYPQGGCASTASLCGNADPPVDGAASVDVPVTCELGDSTTRCASAELPACPSP